MAHSADYGPEASPLGPPWHTVQGPKGGGLSPLPYGYGVGRRPAPDTLDPERHACPCMGVCYPISIPIAIIFYGLQIEGTMEQRMGVQTLP
jgi:hypothetical protein